RVRGGSIMNPTTDPALRSWLQIAADSPFPIQNLPLGAFRRAGEVHAGVAIGDEVLDLTVLAREGKLDEWRSSLAAGALNDFLAAGRSAWSALRARVSALLQAGEAALREDARLREAALVPQASVEMVLPARVGDYTDFYSSKEHAHNVGT